LPYSIFSGAADGALTGISAATAAPTDAASASIDNDTEVLRILGPPTQCRIHTRTTRARRARRILCSSWLARCRQLAAGPLPCPGTEAARRFSLKRRSMTRVCAPPNGSVTRHSAESFVAIYWPDAAAAPAKSCAQRTASPFSPYPTEVTEAPVAGTKLNAFR